MPTYFVITMTDAEFDQIVKNAQRTVSEKSEDYATHTNYIRKIADASRKPKESILKMK